MRAIMLAGGFGTRLRPYTISIPKPLVPIVDTPIAEILLRQLKQAGVDHVTLAVNHQADLLKAYFGDGAKFGLKIDHSLETKPLGTMGPLRLISDLPENFFVLNGDVLTDLDFAGLMRRHKEAGALFTISAAQREHLVDFGVLRTSDAGHLTGFDEKPKLSYLVSMGVYCVNRAVVEHVPADQLFGFDTLMLRLLELGLPVKVEPHAGYWLDIGRPSDYEKAISSWDELRGQLGLAPIAPQS